MRTFKLHKHQPIQAPVSNPLYTDFNNPEEYEIRGILETFSSVWANKFSNFCYRSPLDLSKSDKENVLALAKSVINLSQDYRRVTNLLNGTAK